MVDMLQTQDLYRILQVDPEAEPEVIEAAYRRLALKYHPDVNKTPDAAERMRRLNMAYEVLSSATKRAEYDRQRAQMLGAARSARPGTGVPKPRIRVEPSALRFGPLPRGSTQTAELRITLEGMGSLRGSVRPNQPWMRASVAEVDGQTCTIEVTVDTANLRDGWRHSGSLTVGTILGASQTVPVTVDVAPDPRPALRCEPEVLDFGEVYAGAGPVAKEFLLRNGGTGTLAGRVQVSHVWLAAQPEHFEANEQSVVVTVQPGKLKPGHRYASRLLVETNGGITYVPVRVRVSPLRHPLPPEDSPDYWPELLSRLLPVEKWEKDFLAEMSLRAQQKDWRPTEQQCALIARIKSRGLRD
jgi:hypothetical protein